MTPTETNSQVYAQYQRALTALTSISDELGKAVQLADEQRRVRVREADTVAQTELDRLSKLRRTLTGRYSATEKDLKEAGLPLPKLVRPITVADGSQESLKRAIDAQSEVEASIQRSLSDLLGHARCEEKASAERKLASQQAQDALRRRQEQIKRTQAAEAAEREQRAVKERNTRTRQLLIAAGVGLIALLATLTIVVITFTN